MNQLWPNNSLYQTFVLESVFSLKIIELRLKIGRSQDFSYCYFEVCYRYYQFFCMQIYLLCSNVP
jgi:hypothetical protein